MEYQLTGRVEKIFDVTSITKKDGTQMLKYSFIVNTQENNFNYKAAFTVVGDERWNKLAIQVGGTYNISFSVSSREWNGRCFTELTAYKAYRLDGQQQQTANNAPQPQAAPQPQPQQSEMNFNGNDDGMPF